MHHAARCLDNLVPIPVSNLHVEALRRYHVSRIDETFQLESGRRRILPESQAGPVYLD